MSDIRRLRLDEAKDKQVTALSIDRYKLGWEKVEELEDLLGKLVTYSYWSPEFQAWYPFVRTYLQSGINPKMAAVWLPRLSEKATVIGPPSSPWSPFFAEVLALDRTRSVEVFEGYSWDSIVKFTERIPMFIDNEKVIRQYLFSPGNYQELLGALLARGEYQAYSPNLVEAIYLYRHCMLDYNPATQQMVDDMQAQIGNYVAQFAGVFENVCLFAGEQISEFAWYNQKIKTLICNAWLNCLNVYSGPPVITADDAFGMPSWLSEEITKYLQSLPCVMTSPVSQQFVFDALEYAFLPSATLADPQMVYAFCVPKDYVKTFLEKLSAFYWDVREGRLVPHMIARIESQYTSDTSDEAKTPEEYKYELLGRGFPMEGM